MNARILLPVLVCLVARSAAGQSPMPAMGAGMPGVGGMPDAQSMMAAYQKAQAAASRPGDDKLDCRHLQSELMASVNDPGVQARAAQSAEAAKRDMGTVAAGEAAWKADYAASAATGIASAAAPGGQWAGYGKAVAEAEAGKAQAAGRMQERAMQAQGIMESLPQMLRAQRLHELGEAKGCDWARAANTDAVLPPDEDDATAAVDEEPKKKKKAHR